MTDHNITKYKTWGFLGSLLVLLVGLLVGAQCYDQRLAIGGARVGGSAWDSFLHSVSHHVHSDIGMLLIQLMVILVVVRAVGWLFNKIHQPTVIGEILAGILLGPSFLGYVWPAGAAWLFPADRIGNIELLSQFGLILFMFTIGMELRIRDIKGHARESLIISQSGILLPFVLGILLTWGIFEYTDYASGRSFLSLALFVGISLSITAFPVLARIIQERSLTHSHLGRLALSTAATGDIVAWLMLAAIMAVTQGGSFVSALYNLLFLAVYLVVIFGVIRPLFGLVGRTFRHREVVSKSLMGLIFIFLLASAYFTEIMSMHALFGAFMLGLIMPESLDFRVIVKDKVEDLSLLLLLPLFFVSSGLRTQFGLLNTPDLWWLFVIVTIVAISGKLGGTYISARLCGIPMREGLYLGAYMNTRGLMELVVLRIGLDLGVLPPVLFSILVLMTLVTTVITAPMLQLIDWILRLAQPREQVRKSGQSEVLISFGRPETGVSLLRLFHRLYGLTDPAVGCTVMHVTTDVDISTIDAEHYYESNFAPTLEEARSLELEVKTKYDIADSAPERIVSYAAEMGCNLLLIGASINLSVDEEDRELVAYHNKLRRRWGKIPMSATDLLMKTKRAFEDKISTFVSKSSCSVGIFVDHGYTCIERPLVMLRDTRDEELIPFAEQLALRSTSPIDLLLLSNHSPREHTGEHRTIHLFSDQFDFSAYDFILVSYETWINLNHKQVARINDMPSLLILNIDQTGAQLPALERTQKEAPPMVLSLGKN